MHFSVNVSWGAASRISFDLGLLDLLGHPEQISINLFESSDELDHIFHFVGALAAETRTGAAFPDVVHFLEVGVAAAGGVQVPAELRFGVRGQRGRGGVAHAAEVRQQLADARVVEA